MNLKKIITLERVVGTIQIATFASILAAVATAGSIGHNTSATQENPTAKKNSATSISALAGGEAKQSAKIRSNQKYYTSATDSENKKYPLVETQQPYGRDQVTAYMP